MTTPRPQGSILVTGISGVGKSTVAKALADKLGHTYTSIGDCIQAQIGKAGPIDRDRLRRDPFTHAPPDIVRDAVNQLIASQAALPANASFLDGAGVAYSGSIVRCTPFSTQDLVDLNVVAIILIEARPDLVSARLAQRSGRQDTISSELLLTAQSLQRSLAVSYSHSRGCPLYLFENSGSAEECIADAERIVRSITGSH